MLNKEKGSLPHRRENGEIYEILLAMPVLLLGYAFLWLAQCNV